MKRLVSYLLISVTVLMFGYGFSSCSSDGYSLGDFWVSWATVTDQENANSFVLDDGKTIWVAASNANYVPKNKRVIIDYTILSDNFDGYDHAIKLNRYMADVLTKDIRFAEKEDENIQAELGNDPITVHEMWEGGGYLNIKYGINVAGEKPHVLNLVSFYSYEHENGKEGEKAINLEFRHNNSGDPENYPSMNYVSFNLKSLRDWANEKGEVNLRVKVKEHKGEKVYTVTYKVKELEGEKKHLRNIAE